MSGVHQFVPMLHVGDAVGRHTLALQDLFRASGVASDVFVEREDPETAPLTRLARDYPEIARPDDVVLYQFATESDLVPWLAARPERLVVNYHNVTPAELFAPWDNALARAQLRARAQLDTLAARATLGVAVSEFNRSDLVAAGFGATAVVPPVVAVTPDGVLEDVAPGHLAPDGATAEGDRAAGSVWLVVGRLAPNKAVEDVLAALFLHRRRHDPAGRLVVIGKPAIPSYVAALQEHVAQLDLFDAVQFAGRVDDERLSRAYRQADVLMVASDHEGFCLPVVEAMAHGLPVVAYRQGALPEVLGDAGVLVDDKDPASLAAAAHRLTTDPAARVRAIEAGRRRLPQLGLSRAGDRLVELVLAVRAGRPLPVDRHGNSASAAPHGPPTA